jgi:hypothetical protein
MKKEPTETIVFNMDLGIILFVVFLVLKLTKTIDWSWWWVTSPLWVPVLVFWVLFSILGIVTILFSKR